MTKKKELNIEEIKKLIPHRYPFLLIDKLIEIEPNKSAATLLLRKQLNDKKKRT